MSQSKSEKRKSGIKKGDAAEETHDEPTPQQIEEKSENPNEGANEQDIPA